MYLCTQTNSMEIVKDRNYSNCKLVLIAVFRFKEHEIPFGRKHRAASEPPSSCPLWLLLGAPD